MATRLNLTRDQLATFLKDHEQIKQFERLFSIASDVEPASDTQGISVSADTALALAHQANAEVDLLSDVTATADAALEGLISQLSSELNTLSNNVVNTDAALEGRIDSLSELLVSLASKVEGLEQTPPVQPHKRSRYGSFYDTTTQTAAAINTAYGMTFNTTSLSNGVTIGTPASRIYVDTQNVYNIQFSAQLDNTSGGNHLAFIWLRVNGVDVTDSAGQTRVKGNDGELVAAWNYVLPLNAGDYFEIMWSVSDTAIQILAQTASAPVPGIPSVILTVSDNIQGVES
jgi:hypothetical protein